MSFKTSRVRFALMVVLVALCGSRLMAVERRAAVETAGVTTVVEGDPSAAPRYYGAFGHIGIAHGAASYEDLIAFSEQLASDKRFRVLIVRLVSQDDWGVQFVYTGKDVDREFMDRLIERFRKRFGRENLVSINAMVKITSESGARALGVVAFRPID